MIFAGAGIGLIGIGLCFLCVVVGLGISNYYRINKNEVGVGEKN